MPCAAGEACGTGLTVALIFVPGVPIIYPIGGLVLFGVVFPIAFYRSSRGLWASFLFLTGNHLEKD